MKHGNSPGCTNVFFIESHFHACLVKYLFFLTENELSNEVGRLQDLLSRKNDVNDIALLKSPKTNPRVLSREKFRTPPKKKQNSCTKESEIQDEEAAIVPYGSYQGEQILVSELYSCNSILSGNVFKIYCIHA